MSYVTNTDWPAVAERVRTASRVAVCTHERPDGDALGSALALGRAIPGYGPEVDVLLVGAIEPALRALIGSTPVHEITDAERDIPRDDYDLVLIVDTGSWSQLETLAPWLRRHHDRAIGIDHHRDGHAETAARRIVDPSAAAAAQMVLVLLNELEFDLEHDASVRRTGGSPWPGAGSVAEALFIGLATDTGWFRFSNADAAAFAAASRLLAAGIDKPSLYSQIEETYGPERIALEARALASVQWLRDGAVAVQSLTPRDFAETGGSVEALTNIVNGPMIVAQVRVSILLVELEDGRTKLSFRAKPGPREDDLSRVNDLAAHFGGGGHAFAAGARSPGGLVETRARLAELLEDREVPATGRPSAESKI